MKKSPDNWEFAETKQKKVKIPQKVEVLDAKYGNVIGYRDRNEVFNLVQEDVRFIVNVTTNEKLQLIYSPKAALAGMTILCESLDLYAKYISAHLDTATSCDDVKRKWLLKLTKESLNASASG
jgi:hypothetical protein